MAKPLVKRGFLNKELSSKLMINKDELLGEYSQVYSKGKNIVHVFGNLLAPLSHLEELEREGLVTPHLENFGNEALKLIKAYKSLLDDFPKFREQEMNVDSPGTASTYVREKYLELRGKPLE